jgi:hypothetical protein
LIKLLQDSSLAKRIAAEAKRRVTASASYESQMAKMEELYRNLPQKGTKGTKKKSGFTS